MIGTAIKTVMLDLGNVIVAFDFSRCHAALEKLCPYPAQEIPARIRSTGLVQLFETGQVSPESFVEQVSRILDLHMSYDEFWELWSCIFLPEALIPESLLEGIRSRHRLLLLSNTNPIHFSMVRERYPHLRHFDGYVLSYEVGALKPSPEIYREAIRCAGCRPEECFFTDDIASNVEAARREGIDSVQFHTLSQLEEELRAREIGWQN